MLSQVALELLQYYPCRPSPQRHRPTICRRRRSNENNIDQLLVRVDQNIGNTVRLYVRYNWEDAFDGFDRRDPDHRPDPAAGQQEHAGDLQQTLSPTLLNDFRIGYHRLDFDTLNNLRRQRPAVGRHRARHPGLRRRHALQQPGHPDVDLSGFTGLGNAGTNWYQFDTTFQMSNVLSWTAGTHNIRTGFDLRRLATGRRAANDPRGRVQFHRLR